MWIRIVFFISIQSNWVIYISIYIYNNNNYYNNNMYRIFLVFRFRGINEEGYGRMLAKQFVANEKHPILGVWLVFVFPMWWKRGRTTKVVWIFTVLTTIKFTRKHKQLRFECHFLFFQQNFYVFHEWRWENGRKITELMRYTYTEKERNRETDTLI